MRIKTTPLYIEISSENGITMSPLKQFLKIMELKHNIQLNRLEKHQPHIVPLWWILPFTHIARDPEAVIAEHNVLNRGILRIYTNGSGTDGHVGAAIILPAPILQNICTKRTEYMGRSTTSTVYAAELRGIVLTL
jgi:hypothetical protein